MLQGPMALVVFVSVMGGVFFTMRRCRVQAVLALLLAAFAAGLATGMEPAQVSRIVARGFGGTVEKLGIMIVAGAIIGAALERSGAVWVIADTVLKAAGEKRPALVLSVMGFIISVPVFCEAGFIIFASLIKTWAKRTGLAVATTATALSTGLYATYVLVPPTPGPMAAATALGADVGVVMAMGLFAAVPAAAAGYWWAIRSAGADSVPAAAVSHEEITAPFAALPGRGASFAPLMVPLMLIALKAAANFPGAPLGKGIFKLFIDFAGEPMVALLLGVGTCWGLVSELQPEGLRDWVDQGVKSAAPIVLITGAGGALGGILAAGGIGNCLVMTLLPYNMGIFLPFVAAAILKTVQGSSLAALITTSAIVFPLLNLLGLASPVGTALATMAAGAGAMMVSHVNDPYYWIVAQFSGLDEHAACKTYTAATLIMGVATMAAVWMLTCLLV